MTYAGTVNAIQSVRRLRQQLNVPNVRPLQEDLYATNLAVNAIKDSSLSDFGPPVANVSLNGYRLIDIADPIDDTDAVSKKHLASQLQPIEADLAGVKSTIAGISTVGSGTMDSAARDAIGWPYSHNESIDTRIGTNFTDLATLKGQLGVPYSNANSVDFRLSTLEAGATDNVSREAIGPYDVTLKGSIEQRLTINEADINTELSRVNALNTAVGMPYIGSTVSARLLQLEAKVLSLENKTSYLVGQGMVRVGDVAGGGSGSTVSLTVAGMVTTATRFQPSGTGQNGSSVVTVNWLDPGFQVMPMIVWFNDVSLDPANYFNNDLAPAWMHAQSLSRTSFKVLLEEVGGQTQNVRLFILFYKSDFNVLIN